MATGTTQAIPLPRYFGGFHVDDMLSNDGSWTGLATNAALQNIPDDARSGIQKFFDTITNFFRGIFKWIMGIFVHDSTEAEVGILTRFQNTDAFGKADKILGTDNVGQFIRESAESELRGFVGYTGISKGEAGRNSALQQSVNLRKSIVDFLTKKLKDKVPDEASRTKIADDIATSYSGLTSADADNFTGLETDSDDAKKAKRAGIHPTFGFAKLLIDTGAAAKSGARYSANSVGEFTIDENLLNGITGMVNGSTTATAAAEQQQALATAKILVQRAQQDNLLPKLAWMDANQDKTIQFSEVAANIIGKNITPDDAGYAKFKQLMR